MRCKTCGSPRWNEHPAVSGGGEVTEICEDRFHRPSAMVSGYGTAILMGMQDHRPTVMVDKRGIRLRGGRVAVATGHVPTPIYGGSVPYAVVQQRRARNRRARATRRANRT